MSIKLKYFKLYNIFLLNLLIAMIIIIKPINSSDTPPIDGSIQLTNSSTIIINTTTVTTVPPSITSIPIQQQQQYSDLEELRDINRFNEMYNDFPRISYDTIHQILRDEDSGNGDSIYRRDEKRYQRRWEKSTINNTTTNPIDSIVTKEPENISHKKISHTRVKRNSIADNLDLTSEWNSNNNNNNNSDSDKYINSSRINSTKFLDLTNSNLTTIFELNNLINHSIYNKIEFLNLTNNKLLEFNYKNLMINLNELQILDLTQNQLSEFILNYNQLRSLKILNLTGNRINKISTKITQLPFNNNNTTNPIIFRLKELSLRNNCIKSINSLNLTMLNDLEILDLSYNQISKLNEQFLVQVKNIKYLNLSKNRLGDGNIVDTHVQNRNNSKINHKIDKKIERSTLYDNKKFNSNTTTNTSNNTIITTTEPITIFKEPFYNLLNIDTLILSYNNIRFIDFETFMALPNLQYLDLSHNMIQGESIKSLQGIPDLVGLSIAYNPDLGDSLQEFVASWSLKELDASGTGLCRIPAALAQSVRTLKLMDNWLSIINCGDLDSYPLLQYLDLSHSHIDDIEEDALGRLEMLETLFLDHNNLKRIPISLPTSLINLFLHENQITDIQPQYFQGLHNLKTLDLSYNKLLYLPGLPLPKLLTLNLQSSELKRLSQSVVKTSPKLRDLLLDNNPIKCSDLLGIAEWTRNCHGEENYDNRHTNTPTTKDIKKYFQQKFNYFVNFEKDIITTNHDCCLNYDIVTQKNIKQIVPKCVAAAVNLKNKQLALNLQFQTNETMITTTTTNGDEKLDNFKDKLLNLSTNIRSIRHWPTTENVGQQEHIKKITPNGVDIIKLNFTTTTSLPPEHTIIYNYAVDSIVNTQENIIKENKENLTFSTVTTITTVDKFSEKEGNSLNKINEKTNIINVIPPILKSFSSISGNTGKLMTTTLTMTTTNNPTIELVFKRDKQQMNIITKKKSLQTEIEMIANKNFPILSLSLNNSTEIIDKYVSKNRKNLVETNTENKIKQDNSNIAEQDKYKFRIESNNNYVNTINVLLNQNGPQHQQPQNNNDENFQKTLDKITTKINKNPITLGEMNKKNNTIIENLPTKMIIKNNENLENFLFNKNIAENTFNERTYLHQKNEMTKKLENFHKINETKTKNIGKFNENKIHDRRLYNSSKLLKDKQEFSIIPNPLNRTLLTTTNSKDENDFFLKNNNNMKNPILAAAAPLPLNSIDKENENENSKKNLQQQQKHISDEINRLEIKRRKIYKNNNNQKRRNEKTNIKKKSSIIVESNENKSTLTKITTTESATAITMASIKSKNKQLSRKVNNKADKVIFSNNSENNVNTMTYSDVSANENVIIKDNQKNSSTIMVQQQQKSANQQKIYDKNILKFFTTTSKSKYSQPQNRHQIPPILLQENLLYQEKYQMDNLILNNKRPLSIPENHSIVKELYLNTEKVQPTLTTSSSSSRTGKLIIQSKNNQLKRNLKSTNLSIENIVLHKSINLDKHQEFDKNKTKSLLIGNNDNNNTRISSKMKIDHNDDSSSNIKGSNKMIEIFKELNKRDNINSDLTSNRYQFEKDLNKNVIGNNDGKNIKVLEIENLMSDQKDELTNDNFNDLYKTTSQSSNSYHHYSNDDDNDSKILKENLKKSFNEFKKDTTEFIKLEHQQHFNHSTIKQQSSTSLSELTAHDNNRQSKLTTKKIDIGNYENINSNNNKNKNDNHQFENHLKVNTEIIHQLQQKNLNIGFHNFSNHNKLNNNINSISSNNNNTKIVSALEDIRYEQQQHLKDNINESNKINISKNNHHKIIGNDGDKIDNNGNSLSPEQWLEIRLNNHTTTTGHPGLFIVIGITFSLIFLLGIIHIYRCHRKPWYYNHHNNRQHNHHHHNLNDKNYYSRHDYRNCCRRQQYHLNQHKCNDYRNSEQNDNSNDDQIYCCQCNDDDINDYYIEMTDKNLGKSLSIPSIPLHRKNIFPMELLRVPLKTIPTTTISTLSSKIDNHDYDDNVNDSTSINSNGTSHFGNNFTSDEADRPLNGRKQW